MHFQYTLLLFRLDLLCVIGFIVLNNQNILAATFYMFCTIIFFNIRYNRKDCLTVIWLAIWHWLCPEQKGSLFSLSNLQTSFYIHPSKQQICVILLYLSGQKEMGANTAKASVKTKEYVWRQNRDCVRWATCWPSNWLYYI